MIINLINRYKLLLAIIVLIIAGTITVIYLSVGQQPSQNNPNTQITSPTPFNSQTGFENNPFSPYQKALIGKTTGQELEQQTGFIRKENLGNGASAYYFRSEIISRPDIVETQNNIAVYQRTTIPVSVPVEPGTNLPSLLQRYGQPNRTITGSKEYGWMYKTYIYSDKGVSFLANPNTDEVIEFSTFKPLPLEQYISLYGEDLDPEAKPPQEIPD